MTSNNIRSLSEVNTRFLYALRSIGCGISAGKIFTAIMNLSPPNTKVKTYTARILQGTREASEASMRNAAAEAVKENEGQDEIAAAFDVTWEMKGCPPSTHVIRGKGGPTLTSMHRYHR
ncbi:MAG: hypothetical protein ACKESA_01020 [Candidatus Hodgkinia cicadicola]